MKQKELLSMNGRKIYLVIVVVFLIICLIMGVLCFRYYQQLQNAVENESSEYLQEISKQIGNNANRAIVDNFSVLGTISTVIKNAGVQTYEELQPVVVEQQQYWNYQNIFLIDASGNAYDAYGSTVLLSSDEYLREAILNRKHAMSASQVLNGQESLIFAIPLDGVTIEGKPMMALAASYDLSTLDQILSMTSFGGRGYAHIIQKDGAIVVRSSSEYAPKTGYNILNSLAKAEMDGGYNMDAVRRNINEGKSGMVAFNLDGVHSYMAYTPLDTKEWCLLTFVPVEVVNAKSEMMLKITLLMCSIITLAFAVLFAYLMLSSYRHKLKLENIAYVDSITGGNTIQRFYLIGQELLDNSSKPQYALVYLNVEKFKFLNEQFGRHICDDMLKSIQKGILKDLSSREVIGRLFADNFCILVEYKNERQLSERFLEWYSYIEKEQQQLGSLWLSPVIELGVYVISNDSVEFAHMIDRAKLSLKETINEHSGRLRYAIYDDAVRKQLFREKHLEDIMEEALLNREFLVYLQPKYKADTEMIGGAEALARWKRPDEGMIFPDEFIPLFEKNGFIKKLDLWVFEEVCAMLRAWLDEGKTPVKVSVNCSRVHLKTSGFLKNYISICKKYNIPEEYLEIELTENVVFEDVERLTMIINEIHNAGFGCSMDDFGSGYSSLNLIQDIPVDTIKLDKVFFRSGAKDLERTESVVGSILNMSKSLKMTTVAEGVEEKEQVDMLRRLGCDYLQGYYYARPMPVCEFEEMVFNKGEEA